MLSSQFTNSISPSVNSLGTLNKTLKVVLKTVFTTSISNIYSKTGRCEGHCYWEFPVISLNATILSQPENYSKEVAKFSLYGKADDGFKFNINGVNVASFQSRCTKGNCTNKSDWIASVHSYDFSLQSQTNNLLIKAYSIKNDYWAEIYSAVLTVETTSKQFTDTITSKATQLLSNSISTNLAIQNQETFTFKALDPGSNQVVGYSKSYIFTKKLRASFKYAKHIIVKFSGTANDYATINLNLGGNNYNYQSNASYYFAGCYSSVKPDGSFVDFVNYNLDQNINFNNNQVNVKITQHGTCALWTDISVQGSILVQYKQFTDTIRANFDNFNSKLSIPINIKNYDDINISKVENYYCNGNSLTFQPHIYNYKIAYWRVVKSIEIEISGQSDDYAQVIVNNSITVHPNLQDTLGIKDGIYIWGKTQSSDYVKEKHPFTMTNENLNIQFGTVNTLPTVCYLKASLKIRLFFQFTDTINTVNPDCNVKAETKYQSVNITLPFNLVISPQDRWCEIHLSRVDYITTVSGGFPNTAVRVDFTSSSGHDPNYSNRIMYFDANGNLTFSNFCTQQSHSGSVDTWNITYMGKHYHFTIHWYW